MGIEEHLLTKSYSFFIFTGILGMCIFDAFKLYAIIHPGMESRGIKEFMEAAAAAFLTDNSDGCADMPLEGRRLRKRGADAMMGDDEVEEDGGHIHSLISVSEWKIQQFGRNSLGIGAQEKGAKMRCQVDRCGEHAYYCCLLCSNANKKAFGVCGPRSTRDCHAKHVHAMSLE